ncbi:hypothetical protein [Paenibacillus dokdonensis]|uniref:hypothetical protein n=1 Tax=Paenibacillus dokdonensis TaxID=2567944 RepID=UPI003D269463
MTLKLALCLALTIWIHLKKIRYSLGEAYQVTFKNGFIVKRSTENQAALNPASRQGQKHQQGIFVDPTEGRLLQPMSLLAKTKSNT